MKAFKCDRCGLVHTGGACLTSIPMDDEFKLIRNAARTYELCVKCFRLLEGILKEYMIDCVVFDDERKEKTRGKH